MAHVGERNIWPSGGVRGCFFRGLIRHELDLSGIDESVFKYIFKVRFFEVHAIAMS